jgi:hypothetical protein
MGCYRFCTFSWAAGVKVWNTVDLSPGRTQQSSIPLEDGRRGVYSVFHLPPVPLGGSLGQALITFWPLLVCKVSCLGFPQIRAVKHLKLSCNLDLVVLYLLWISLAFCLMLSFLGCGTRIRGPGTAVYSSFHCFYK